ncbi:synaptosomal-associated protein 29 [Ceratina calcarata]|uniref:Synaptosomal-associated protein 29 n=1 Tax=Ceratina calcarata TaxID=156304 RepID=A0AAJ7WFE6_9HYME|nr:synaptosomal-associated protein 29 [Ceratina calcarata]
MASHNYLSDPTNSLFSLQDDIDDETFLKSARPSGRTPYNHYSNYDDELQQKHQQLLQRKKAIEERTVKSSERSISLLRDSEQIGAATAEVIVIQDDINSTLRFSQKHIQGIKSVFGSLKNYLSGKSMDAPIPSTILSESSSSDSMASPALSNSLEQVQTNIANTSPALKLHGIDDYTEDTKPLSNNVSKILEKNLDEMSGSLARLKGLAIGLSEEIDLQNDLIDNITNKAEKTDIMLQKQNKDLTHLLKK